MKSVLPLAVCVIGAGALVYIYLRQRDKDKKKKPDTNNQSPKAKVDTLETLEFKVENNLVPLIVGRNSVNLKLIEEKTNTHIKFRELDEENQMCSICGKVDDVKQAKELIDAEAKKQPIITDEILLPTSSCGKIEGYCGSILHEICQKSSAKVWVDPGVRKVQGENRRVLITGTKEQVEIAKKLIEEKISEPPVVEQLSIGDEEKKDRKSLSPFPSNSSITTTESPREVMLPSPEKLKNVDGKLEVCVSAVNSPSRFWVQLCGSQRDELQYLVNAMTEYYSEKENQELHKIREPYLGQIVAALYLNDNNWYRAEVVAIEPKTDDLTLDVYFLDYGDQQFVSRKEILELRADFLSLRFQAIECFLAHVQPLNTGSKFEEWDRKAIEKFEELVEVAQYKKLISKVVTSKDRKSFALQRPSNKRESSPIPGVELYEEHSERNIALELVQSGHAEMSDRFGDLTKSSVLNVVVDDQKSSKEVAPEPIGDKDLNESQGSDQIEVADALENISSNEQLVEQTSSESNQTDNYVEEEQPEVEQTQEIDDWYDNKPDQKAAEDADWWDEEPAKQTPEEPAKVPFDKNNNNNDENFDPKSISNGAVGKSKKNATSSKDDYSGGDSSKFSKGKKKQQDVADFLKNEKEFNAPKKFKSKDWNEMLDSE